MNKKEITNKIQNSLNNSIPNKFDDILLKCPEKKGSIVMNNVEKENKSKTNLIPKLSFALATFVLVLVGILTYNSSHKIDSIIQLDVNPSIELEVSKDEKIIKAIAKNDDAEKVLKDMNLEKTDVDVALNAIIGSMITKGYINDLSNSILVSVENDDKIKGEELRKKLAAKIESIIGTDKIKGSILSQNITNNNTEANELSQKYNISLGKATLILDILASDSTLKVEDLVNMSINELNVISESKTTEFNNVKKEGSASTKAYISVEKAKEIAFKHAGVSNPKNIDVEFDADDGLVVYDVEFETSTMEYDYEIDAINGNIIKSDKEKKDNDDDKPTPSNSNGKYISSSEAKQIALKHAGVSNPSNLKVELDKDDNEYSVKFEYQRYEFDYEINATTGTIKDYDKEFNDNNDRDDDKDDDKDDDDDNKPTQSDQNKKYISSSKAKQIALNHAGVSNPSNLKVELDKDDNEYSVEFKYKNYEYEYEINATTGAIKNVDKERDD